MTATRLSVQPVSSPLRTAFSISRGSKTCAETVQVALVSGEARGRGECVPYGRYGEIVESVTAQIESVRAEIERGMDRAALQKALPAGAARCAVDCAMWDLEAKQTGEPVWQLAGLPEPKPLPTAVTIVLGEPDDMAHAARHTKAGLLKLKLGGPDDLERLRAVTVARPDAKLIVDANEGLSPDDFPALAKQARDNQVVLIEQPFPAGKDSALLKRASPLAICADESAHTSESLEDLVKAYDAVNVKLDKTGGLTEAIAMVKAARAYGFDIMIGCMVAGSLSMAPAFLLGGLADAIDLDGPLWLSEDIEHGMLYTDGLAHPPSQELWG